MIRRGREGRVMRVLIADDDPVCRHLLVRTLQAWGYEVTAAKDGAEAWKAVRGARLPARHPRLGHARRGRPRTRPPHPLLRPARLRLHRPARRQQRPRRVRRGPGRRGGRLHDQAVRPRGAARPAAVRRTHPQAGTDAGRTEPPAHGAQRGDGGGPADGLRGAAGAVAAGLPELPARRAAGAQPAALLRPLPARRGGRRRLLRRAGLSRHEGRACSSAT